MLPDATQLYRVLSPFRIGSPSELFYGRREVDSVLALLPLLLSAHALSCSLGPAGSDHSSTSFNLPLYTFTYSTTSYPLAQKLSANHDLVAQPLRLGSCRSSLPSPPTYGSSCLGSLIVHQRRPSRAQPSWNSRAAVHLPAPLRARRSLPRSRCPRTFYQPKEQGSHAPRAR